MSLKKTKGESTRSLILETALRLFRERGFEETTMRLIAEEAGVALGNAYYYFRSKDDLVHAFYTQIQTQQFEASLGVLAAEQSLKNRLTGAIRAQLTVVAPYHRMFSSLFKIAADPDNTLNPFGQETREVRERCIQHFREIVLGSTDRIPDDLQVELPQLLWMYYMGLVLFWIYDRSPGFVRTYRLLEMTAEIIVQLLGLASLPLMVPMRKMVLKSILSLKEI